MFRMPGSRPETRRQSHQEARNYRERMGVKWNMLKEKTLNGPIASKDIEVGN